MSYPGHLFVGQGSFPSAVVQLVYSTAPADWAGLQLYFPLLYSFPLVLGKCIESTMSKKNGGLICNLVMIWNWPSFFIFYLLYFFLKTTFIPCFKIINFSIFIIALILFQLIFLLKYLINIFQCDLFGCLDSILVFANSHLMMKHGNQLAIIASHTNQR